MWNYRCQTNATVSHCSVGCGRMAGCKISSNRNIATCVPDPAQCACSPAMLPLVETMYWSCEGDHWEVEKLDWKVVVEALGCSAAFTAAPARFFFAVAAAVSILHVLAGAASPPLRHQERPRARYH